MAMSYSVSASVDKLASNKLWNKIVVLVIVIQN